MLVLTLFFTSSGFVFSAAQPIPGVDISAKRNGGGHRAYSYFTNSNPREEQLLILKDILITQGFGDINTKKDKTLKDLKPEIKKFQKKFGIKQTGVLGPVTLAKINSEYFTDSMEEGTSDALDVTNKPETTASTITNTQTPPNTATERLTKEVKALKKKGIKCTGCSEWHD